MPDYGQPLQFGAFPTPDASDPERLIEYAVLAERSGLELLVVQDHPYQRRYLDAWALMATVLAKTSTLRVAPGVANLPLRPPFVLAKTVASLDLLSGGRVELGLGAGGFWDAIEAAGGPRRTPREALESLTEAIAIIRAVWNTEERSVRVEGRHYRVVGAHPGPAPAHPVEIWLGSYGPKMLALTGRTADGWFPSWGHYLAPAGLAGANARIDDAAQEAGRDPAAIRRLYNVSIGDPGLAGGPGDWPEQLAELALRDGMSGFVLWHDDPALVQEWGLQVAPATRELVAAARG